jgi:hypothetical protein
LVRENHIVEGELVSSNEFLKLFVEVPCTCRSFVFEYTLNVLQDSHSVHQANSLNHQEYLGDLHFQYHLHIALLGKMTEDYLESMPI